MICSSLNEQQNNENTKLPNLTTYYLIPNSIQRLSCIFIFKPHGGQNEESEARQDGATLVDSATEGVGRGTGESNGMLTPMYTLSTMIRFLKNPTYYVHNGYIERGSRKENARFKVLISCL